MGNALVRTDEKKSSVRFSVPAVLTIVEAAEVLTLSRRTIARPSPPGNCALAMLDGA
jgi:hypothetical protein